MENVFYVYMMTNKWSTTLYTGVTNDLARRVVEHKSKVVDGFSKKYEVDKLVYFNESGDINEAIAEEKRIKGGSRAKKIALIEEMNPEWRDLSEDFLKM
jgi:putative endonuclease